MSSDEEISLEDSQNESSGEEYLMDSSSGSDAENFDPEPGPSDANNE